MDENMTWKEARSYRARIVAATKELSLGALGGDPDTLEDILLEISGSVAALLDFAEQQRAALAENN